MGSKRKKRMTNIPDEVKDFYIKYMKEHPGLTDKEYQERLTPSKTTIGRLCIEAFGYRRKPSKRDEGVIDEPMVQPMFVPVDIVSDRERLLQAMKDDPEAFLDALGINVESEEK